MRKSVSDEERVEWALARHTFDMERKRFPSLDEIAFKVERDPSVVSSGIKAAFERRLVVVQRSERPVKPTELVPELAERLRGRFSQLRKVIVVKTGDAKSDVLHSQLGMEMARHLHASAWIRDGETVGVGSGRGVFYTAQALHRMSPLPAEHVKLVSLTGRVYPRDHGLEVNVPMDADNHLTFLALCFGRHLTLSPIFSEIVRDSENPTDGTPLERKHWAEPDHALIGVGVLWEGHRFYNLIKKPDTGTEDLLSPIVSDLSELVEVAEEVTSRSEGYFPVGDVCHNLFFVPPPSGARIEPGEEKLIRRKIESINDKLVNVKEHQLSEVPMVSLIAGSSEKVGVIRQLLSDESKIKIRLICTDDVTAETLLSPANPD